MVHLLLPVDIHVPGHPSSHGVDCIGYFTALGFHQICKLFDRVLTLTDGHSIAWNHNHLLGPVKNHGDFFRIAANLGSCQLVFSPEPPNALNRTSGSVLFIALHIMKVRINPAAPTIEPAMIRTLLPITKPVNAAAIPRANLVDLQQLAYLLHQLNHKQYSE